MLSGLVEDEAFEKEFSSVILPQWERYREDASALVEDFVKEMSPAGFLEEYPLNRIQVEERVWIALLVEQLWKSRYPIAALVKSAEAAIEAADTAYVDLKAAVPPGLSVSQSAPLLAARFRRFQADCQAVAKAFEQFPAARLVT